MKNRLLVIYSFCFLFLAGCSVDEFQDFNPPRLLDAPQFTFELGAEDIVGGTTTSFTITVIDAPGGISDSIVFATNDDLGSFEFTNLTSLIGQNSGEITGTFTAPTNFSGEFTITCSVFDQQLDDENEDAAKGASQSATIDVSYPGDAPNFTTTLSSSTIVRGNSLTISVTLDVPDGFKSILIFPSTGSVEVDQASVDAAVGQSTGVITAVFQSDDVFVGTADIAISVTDQVQERTTTETSSVTINYAEAGPSIDLSFTVTEMNFFESTDLTAVITTPGIASSITIEAYTRESFNNFDEDDENSMLISQGSIELGAGEVDAVIGTTGGTVTGTFSTPSLDYGYATIVVTVVDEQGREMEATQEILVQSLDFCTYQNSYTTTASGTAGSAYTDLESTVTATQVGEFILEFDDMSFGVYSEIYEIASPSGRIQFDTCDGTGTFTDLGDTDQFADPFTINGSFNADGSISLTWSNTFGDSGTVELTPAN